MAETWHFGALILGIPPLQVGGVVADGSRWARNGGYIVAALWIGFNLLLLAIYPGRFIATAVQQICSS